MDKGYAFYLLVAASIILYFVAAIIGIPDHKFDEYTERSIGIIMKSLFMVPMVVIIPLIITGAIYYAVESEYRNKMTGESMLAFTYSSLTLLSAVLFMILAQRHNEYQPTSWVYLSSAIILFVSIYFRSWGRE